MARQVTHYFSEVFACQLHLIPVRMLRFKYRSLARNRISVRLAGCGLQVLRLEWNESSSPKPKLIGVSVSKFENDGNPVEFICHWGLGAVIVTETRFAWLGIHLVCFFKYCCARYCPNRAACS
jgi:hypothetical protein